MFKEVSNHRRDAGDILREIFAKFRRPQFLRASSNNFILQAFALKCKSHTTTHTHTEYKSDVQAIDLSRNVNKSINIRLVAALNRRTFFPPFPLTRELCNCNAHVAFYDSYRANCVTYVYHAASNRARASDCSTARSAQISTRSAKLRASSLSNARSRTLTHTHASASKRGRKKIDETNVRSNYGEHITLTPRRAAAVRAQFASRCAKCVR